MVVMKDTFYEFLQSFTNIISNNVYSEEDNTVNLLSSHIKNDKIFIIAADKESCTVMLKKWATSRKLTVLSKKEDKINA